MPRNSTCAAIGACGVPTTAVNTRVFATQTVTSAALTLAIAQSPAFKNKFASAVATTLGVTTAAVNVTGVAQVSARRALLAGIRVSYNVVAPSAATATALTTAMAGSSGALVGVLSTSYPGVSIAAPTVTTNTAPPTGAPVKSAAARGSLGSVLTVFATVTVAIATAAFMW